MKIIIFGDSISEGFHDEVSGGWVDRLKQFVIKTEVSLNSYAKSVVNLGVSGDTTEDVLLRIKSESEARLRKYHKTDKNLLILAIGINDTQFDMMKNTNKIPVADTVNNFLKIFSEVGELFSTIVIVGLTPVVDERLQPMPWKPTHGYSNAYIKIYNAALKKIASDNNLLFIDLDNVFDDLYRNLPDGLHPNSEGHESIYKNVKSELEKQGMI